MTIAISALFPLTPALSLREREPSGTCAELNTPAAFRPSLAAILPLPAGEGRGEGERGRVFKEASGLVAPLLLAPGFSRVLGGVVRPNRFNGLAGCATTAGRKPLKRFPRSRRPDTRLKPGANESAVQPTFP